MRMPIFQVDAFTDRHFTGNPAAVVISDTELEPQVMQRIAAENNLSETAFLVPRLVGEQLVYGIRWFSPVAEVALCGHATLAAAHVLVNHRGVYDDEIIFSSARGELRVKPQGALLVMNFPADHADPVDPDPFLYEALGAEPSALYRGQDDLMAVFDSPKQVAGIKPNYQLLSQIACRGVIATAQGLGSGDNSGKPDFVSRFFAPSVGIDEDPVTGSAHTLMIPYWHRRLGRDKLLAHQLSARGGVLHCRDFGERVEIAGQAITYMAGELLISR